jgi:hypothetical protein
MKIKVNKNRPLYERRIKHPFINKKYFSPDFGYFTVEKAWNAQTFHENSEPHVCTSLKFQIKTAYGKLIYFGYQFDPKIFKQECK